MGCDAPVTLIVSNKYQGIRFYDSKIDPQSKPVEQNILPGTVIDSIVVNPNYCEFFLNSHRAIQVYFIF